MKFSLRQLQVFTAAARYQNITRAAESLSMSQSAASGALKDLERQYSVLLFDRIGKRLKLNEFGELLRPQAEALLANAAEMDQFLEGHNRPGNLRIGATLTLGNYIAVSLMAKYMEMHSGTRVSLDVANTRLVVDKVLQYEIDLGLIEGEVSHPELEVSPWTGDHLQIFCAPDHPLASRPQLNMQDVLTADWIMREPGSGTRQTFERCLQDVFPGLNICLELQHTEAIKRAVEAGLGISCLSKITLVEAFKRKSLVPLWLEGYDFYRRFYFVWHKQKYMSAGMHEWLKLCRQHTGS
ncbi:LysR substrate-binding domain-containing protein [Gynuella sp.]|uniref:LysR substrate-binding domain-containing protein n=1 Tax=Gynuella sp. TaxID=2969146 RepID=UPI003D0BB309